MSTVLRGDEEQVRPLELFFDLVFVLAITQCTALMSREPTWEGLAVLGLRARALRRAARPAAPPRLGGGLRVRPPGGRGLAPALEQRARRGRDERLGLRAGVP